MSSFIQRILYSPHSQTASCLIVTTVCTVASLAAAYFCLQYGLPLEKVGKMLGDQSMIRKAMCLEYGALAYGGAALVNGIQAVQGLYESSRFESLQESFKRLACTLAAPLVGPVLLFNYATRED